MGVGHALSRLIHFLTAKSINAYALKIPELPKSLIRCSLFQLAVVAVAIVAAMLDRTVGLRNKDGESSLLTQSYRLSANSRVRIDLMPDRRAYRDDHEEQGLID